MQLNRLVEMAKKSESLAELKEDVTYIFDQTLSSFWSRFGSACTIALFYPGIATLINNIYSVSWGKAFLYATPFAIAFTSIFLGILCIVAYRKILKNIKEYDLEEFRTLDYLCHLDAEFFGRKYIENSMKIELQEDGSATKHQTIKLKAIGDWVNSVDFHGKTSNAPIENEDQCHIIDADKQQLREVDVRPKLLNLSFNECKWELEFIPGLRPGQEVVYGFNHVAPPKAFCMTKEELEKAGDDIEFFSCEIRVPMEKLIIDFIFPKGFVPSDSNYGVWIGYGRYQHSNEWKRIHDKKDKYFDKGKKPDGRMFAKLMIENPIRGLKYAITWKPP
jgi:hypothetical protein